MGLNPNSKFCDDTFEKGLELKSHRHKTTANEETDTEHAQTETKDNSEKFKSMLKKHFITLERSMRKVSAALDRFPSD